jgi:hypothetical protein
MEKLTVVLVSRNDNYGFNLVQRAKFCLLNAIRTADEIIYVDWKPFMDKSLIDELRSELPKTGKIRHIRIEREFIKEHLPDCYTYPIIEVLGRNIGIRRSSYNWILSTNIDIIFQRPILESYNDNTLYVGRRQDVSIDRYFNSKSIDDVLNVISNGIFSKKPYAIVNGIPIHDKKDTWTPVVCCGDFQLAHKKVWNNIRGFEEVLKGRNYADGNIFKKAILMGNKIEVDDSINAFHLDHEGFNCPAKKEPGEELPMNSHDTYINLSETTNDENWGLNNFIFEEEII